LFLQIYLERETDKIKRLTLIGDYEKGGWGRGGEYG